jgi:hypothetical protein
MRAAERKVTEQRQQADAQRGEVDAAIKKARAVIRDTDRFAAEMWRAMGGRV